VILTGAPGTGKTYTSQKVAEALTGSYYERIRKVQFHPGYDYSDFVIGLKPKLENNQVVFRWEDGVFKEFADIAKNDINNMCHFLSFAFIFILLSNDNVVNIII
jgi:5-methylcytosine-specific restriction endonuclease McrBC GTP-binding regulatory subunit McrB